MSIGEDKCPHGVDRDTLSYAAGVRCKECEAAPWRRQCRQCGTIFEVEEKTPASWCGAFEVHKMDPSIFCPACCEADSRAPGEP